MYPSKKKKGIYCCKKSRPLPAVPTHHIRIPHSNRVPDADLAHEKAVHPPEAKLDELDVLLLEVLGEIGVDPGRQVAQRRHLSLDARPRDDVVALDAVEQLRQAPERAGLDGVQHRPGELAGIHARLDVRVGDVDAQEDLPEGGDEVVDTLDVAAGRVAHGPDVEDALERPLGGLVAVELDVRVRARHVDAALVPD